MYSIALPHHALYPGAFAYLAQKEKVLPVNVKKKEFYTNLKVSSDEIALIHACCPFNGPHAFLSVQQLFFLFLSEQIHLFHLQNPENEEIDRLYQKLKRRFSKFNFKQTLRNQKITKVLIRMENLLKKSPEFRLNSHQIFSHYCSILMREHMDQLKLVAFFHPRLFVTDWSPIYILLDKTVNLPISQTILDVTFTLILSIIIQDIEETLKLIPSSVSDLFDKELTLREIPVSSSFFKPEEADEVKTFFNTILQLHFFKKILEDMVYGHKGSDIPSGKLEPFYMTLSNLTACFYFTNLSSRSESSFDKLKRKIGHLFNENFQENMQLLGTLVYAYLQKSHSSQEDGDLLSSKEFQIFLEKHTKISKSARRKEKRRAKALEGKEKQPTALVQQPPHPLEEAFYKIIRSDSRIDRHALRNAAWHLRSVLQLKPMLQQSSSMGRERFFTLFAFILYHSNYAIEQTLSAYLKKNRATHNLQFLSKNLLPKRRDRVISKLFLASFWVPRFVEEKASYDNKMTFFSARKVPGVLHKLNVLALGQISEEQMQRWKNKAGKILEQTQSYLEAFMQASPSQESSSESHLPLLKNPDGETIQFMKEVQNLRFALRQIVVSGPIMHKMMQIDAYLCWAEEALKGCGEAIYLNDYAFWAHKIILSLHDTIAELLLIIASQKSLINFRKHEIPLLAERTGLKFETEDVECFRGLFNKLRYPASEVSKGSFAELIDLLEALITQEQEEELWRSKTQEDVQAQLDQYISTFFRIIPPILEHFGLN